ncbi:hypothetical protein HDU67_002791, partial [Dinochytrium kinnereticum]
APTGQVIGTSVSNFNYSSSANDGASFKKSVVYYDQSSDSHMQFLSGYVASNYNKNLTILPDAMSLRANIDGTDRIVKVVRFTVFKFDWIIVAVLSRDDVLRNVTQQTKITGGIVAAIIVSVLLISAVVSIMISRELMVVVTQIVSLSNMKFTEVLERGHLKNTSFIAEMNILQQSFYQMVQVFSEKIKMSRDLRTGTGTSTSKSR